MDPLSDLYPSSSSFAYAIDNPTTFYDPNGDSVTTNWQYGLDNTINFFVTTPVNRTRSDRQGGPWDLLPSEYAGTKTYGWTESVSSVEQDLPAFSLMDNQRADGSSWLALQHQAALEAKAETNAFYHGLFEGTANVSDRVSESQNYSIAGEALMGQEEAIPVSFAIGETFDVISTVAKGLDILTGGSPAAFMDQLGKSAVNLGTLRIVSTTAAGAKLVDDPVFRTAFKMTLNQIAPR